MVTEVNKEDLNTFLFIRIKKKEETVNGLGGQSWRNSDSRCGNDGGI